MRGSMRSCMSVRKVDRLLELRKSYDLEAEEITFQYTLNIGIIDLMWEDGGGHCPPWAFLDFPSEKEEDEPTDPPVPAPVVCRDLIWVVVVSQLGLTVCF